MHFATAAEEVTTVTVVTEIGEQITAHAKQRAQNAGARNVTTHICAGDIADEILDMAEVEKAGILVPGQRGLGRARDLVWQCLAESAAPLMGK